MITALFTGDSITDAGRRADPTGVGQGYVRRIAEIAAPHLQIVNTGVAGDRVSDLLDRCDTDVIEHQPDVLTILVGINDTWRRYESAEPVGGAEFQDDFRTLLEGIRAGIRLRQLVVMEPFVVPMDAQQLRWSAEDLDEKRALIRELADTFDATFVPLQQLFHEAAVADGPASVVDDGVHPNAGGHELIARTWWSTVGSGLT